MAQTLLQLIRDHVPELQASLKQKRGSVLSPDIKLSFHLRNSDYTSFLNALKGYKTARQEEKVETYLYLKTLMKRSKELRRLNLEDRITLGQSLLTQLGQEKASLAIQTLNLQEFTNNLKDSNQTLYQLYLQRSQEATAEQTIDASAVRKKINSDYKLLYDYLINKLNFNPQDAAKIMVQLLNDIRKEHAEKRRRQ